MIGLSASAVIRCAVGAGFCLLAVALVWSVERRPDAPPAQSAMSATVGATRQMSLSVESTYPVARWRILVLGVEQKGSAAGAYAWHGVISAPAGEDVVVLAEATVQAVDPHRALRVRLGDAPERLVWGAGDVVAAEPVP